jgi:tRNA-splicing ligase RtcB (3'-phosphate/5'-hydroxy nucleic acid ligase)
MQKYGEKLISWASILEESTREQAFLASTMPFIAPHIALMPDAHLGKGATVGSVIPTQGAIIPAAVGVDIGCGMAAVRTQFDREHVFGRALEVDGGLRILREAIERAIPLSAGKYNNKIVETAQPRIVELEDFASDQGFDPAWYARNWREQLGSLGSGNHFIEITEDETGAVWCFLHSGSRGIGNKIATEHIKIARQECEKWWISLPDPDLAYLVEGTDEFYAYISQMHWAQHFALLNREEMMDRVIRQLGEFMGEDVVEQERINCHHNYTEREKHYGRWVWISRKGAIRAEKNDLGLIPGSMGTASYVVKGKANRVALNSSPHGAGRNYSRSAARKTFTHEQLRDSMKGIEFRDSAAFLDEIPAAYKDIDVVMKDADDLVEVQHVLRQIVNVKGE